MPSAPPFKLFVIYAREDQPLLLELKAHLRPLEKRGDLMVWYDGEILPGADWDNTINTHLAAAEIILLFISSYFFDSDYIEKEELKKALERHKKGEAIVVPVILRHCLWDAHPGIGSLQVLPKDGKPVSSWDERDQAWETVGRGIQKIIEKKKLLYTEFLNKEEIKRAVMLYHEHEKKLSYQLLYKFKNHTKIMSPEAYYILGEILYYGEGGAKSNYGEAFECYLNSAKKNYILSQIQIGNMYEEGHGVVQDLGEAEVWYKKAAKRNNAMAQYHLGALYEEFEETTEAIFWYCKSAEQGNIKSKEALKNLGYTG